MENPRAMTCQARNETCTQGDTFTCPKKHEFWRDSEPETRKHFLLTPRPGRPKGAKRHRRLQRRCRNSHDYRRSAYRRRERLPAFPTRHLGREQRPEIWRKAEDLAPKRPQGSRTRNRLPRGSANGIVNLESCEQLLEAQCQQGSHETHQRSYRNGDDRAACAAGYQACTDVDTATWFFWTLLATMRTVAAVASDHSIGQLGDSHYCCPRRDDGEEHAYPTGSQHTKAARPAPFIPSASPQKASHPRSR